MKYTVMTDASDFAIDAVLSQSKIGKDLNVLMIWVL